jgi:DNA-directed RNA polymerase subunit M
MCSSMEFCLNCGSRLIPRKSKASESYEIKLVCPKCGYKKEVGKTIEPTLFRAFQHSPQQLVAIIGREAAQLRTLPTINVECPNCGNNKAYVWLVQTRGSDESSTQFMRCTRCNHTYREYS